MTSDYQGLYYDQLWKNIDCKAMFENDIFDRYNTKLNGIDPENLI